MKPFELSASTASALIRSGDLGCEELLRSCLERIADREPQTRAWLHLDARAALSMARELDKTPWKGPLHGLPVGFKDNIDVAGMPTTFNSPHHSTAPAAVRDAACVRILRESGAIPLGKLDTVEFASSGRRALTRNPNNPAHTPGGSSSGSAAAVADRHVPVSIGTQTAGSLIRPAAFCGVCAFKPTQSLISIEGVKPVAPQVDCLGWFTRAPEDLALVASAFGLMEHGGPAGALPGGRLRVGLCRTEDWGDVAPEAQDCLEAAAGRLSRAGHLVTGAALPAAFTGLVQLAYDLLRSEIAVSLLPERAAFGRNLHPNLLASVTNWPLRGAARAAAQDRAANARAAFDSFMGEVGLDLLLTPSAPGAAPLGLEDTGKSTFNVVWTLLHLPCIALPLGTSRTGLPLSVQLVGRRFRDADLLEHARIAGEALKAE